MPALGTGSKLAGVFAPISTPFAANEDVDHGALRFNLTRYAQSGILVSRHTKGLRIAG